MTEPKEDRLILSRDRLLLSAYFLLVGYVVFSGLKPLPEEPPRIQFHGFTATLLAAVIAGQMVISRYRLFHFSIILSLPYFWWLLSDKIKFQMMVLEPYLLQQVTRWTLPAVLLVMWFPKMFKSFDRKAREYHADPPRFFPKGIPF